MKNSVMLAIDVMGRYEEPLTLSLERPSCHCLSIVKYPTEKSEAIRLEGWIKYLVNPEPIKYNECTGTKDIEYDL